MRSNVTKISKCICGLEPKAIVSKTDKEQVLSFLLIAGLTLFVVSLLLMPSLNPEDYGGWVDPRKSALVFGLVIVFLIYKTVKYKKNGTQHILFYSAGLY
jgi:hypothetical protein